MRFVSGSLQRSAGLAAVLIGASALAPRARGDEVPKEYQETIKRGLAWLSKAQQKDGRWEGVNGQYPIAMTGMAGMALLAEGSTIREGKYRENIRRARDFLLDRVQPNGLIGNPANRMEAGVYMYGHGFALLFLSSVVGEEENKEKRADMVKKLERAAKYSRDAQTNRGGWGYISSREGNNFDEGSVTITQVQALRAARNAGIVVPNDAIKDAVKYLKDSTTSSGGVQYSLAGGFGGDSGRPALTAAAVACGFSAGEYKGDLVKKWLKFCQNNLSIPGDGRRMGHYEYTHYYYAQVVYVLGDDRFKKLFPEAREDELITWKNYRKSVFDEIKRTQNPDGSWGGNVTAWNVGGVYVGSIYLTILQLDRAALPIYQR